MHPQNRDPLNEMAAPPALTNWTEESFEYIWTLDGRCSLIITVYHNGEVTAFVVIKDEEAE